MFGTPLAIHRTARRQEGDGRKAGMIGADILAVGRHEVANNWSDSKDLSADTRYSEKNVPLLVARGARAFLEYAPMRPFDARESQRVYRRYSYGPLLELFVLDRRSYRGAKSAHLQTTPSDASAFPGREQLDRLKRGLKNSRAVWKVEAADMPLGLQVGNGTQRRMAKRPAACSSPGV
jgi:alkaline phosphatase D